MPAVICKSFFILFYPIFIEFVTLSVGGPRWNLSFFALNQPNKYFSSCKFVSQDLDKLTALTVFLVE